MSSIASGSQQQPALTKSEEIIRNRKAIIQVLDTLDSLEEPERTEEQELNDRCEKCQILLLKRKRLEAAIAAERNKNRNLPQLIVKPLLPAWASAYKEGNELKAAELLHESFFPDAAAKKIKLDSGN